MKKEKVNTSIERVSILGLKNILNQVTSCVCKIKIKEGYGNGFFCKIPFKNKGEVKALMTNYHILNEKDLKEKSQLNILLNDDNEKLIIDLKIERAIYYNKDCDISIIQLSEKDKIKNFLKLDEIIFK